jgi:hypothetical protein
VTTNRVLPQRYRRAKGRREVVAFLVEDGSAPRVAEAAADEARTRRRVVRFVVADSGTDLISVALRALGTGSPVQPLVEVAAGDPLPLLVARSADAAVLVLGEGDLAARCLGVVDCPIRFVPNAPGGTFGPAGPGGTARR